MANLTRRSVLCSSLGLATAGVLARPYIANAQAKTAEVWFAQGFAKEEDAAFKAMVAEYEKASSNKIDYSLVPFAPLRQKAVSAMTSGVVPDVMEVADLEFARCSPGTISCSMSATSLRRRKRIFSSSRSIPPFSITV